MRTFREFLEGTTVFCDKCHKRGQSHSIHAFRKSGEAEDNYIYHMPTPTPEFLCGACIKAAQMKPTDPSGFGHKLHIRQ